MHNLIKADLEKLDILPREQHSRKYHDDWDGCGTTDNHRVGDNYPWTIAKRVIKKFMDKSFDQAFAYFCTLVPKYQQHEFMSEFASAIDRKWRYKEYEVVDGIIRKIEREVYKNSPIFYSDDYQSCYYNAKIGKSIDHHDYRNKHIWEPTKNSAWNGKLITINQDDYKLVITSGWKQEFGSWNDPRFVRLRKEREDKKRANDRKLAKEKRERSYIFLTKDELQKKFEAMESVTIRDRHGF